MKYYKVLTYDLRSPIQGGDPIWDGDIPVTLPEVSVDMSDACCGQGWNFCRKAHTALQIAGLWPDGRPSRLFIVEPTVTVIERGNKCRAAQIRIVEEIIDLQPHVRALTETFVDAEYVDNMVQQQMQWMEALSRPKRDESAVITGLKQALDAKKLSWSVRKFDNARDVWEAWYDWNTWYARDAWNASDAWAARDAWYARDVWAFRAARNPWADRAARDARNALLVVHAVSCGWLKVDDPADFSIIDIRDIYKNGLDLAIPTGRNVLGFAMAGGE